MKLRGEQAVLVLPVLNRFSALFFSDIKLNNPKWLLFELFVVRIQRKSFTKITKNSLMIKTSIFRVTVRLMEAIEFNSACVTLVFKI